MASKKTAETTNSNGIVDQGAAIDTREQAERFASMSKIRDRVIGESESVEAQRFEIRKQARDNNTKPNLQGHAMPRIPLAVGALGNDPINGAAFTALAAVVGESTPLFHFIKKEQADSVVGVSWRVFLGEVDGEAQPIVVDYTGKTIPGGEFVASQTGNGAHAFVRFGDVILKLTIVQSEQMAAEREKPEFKKDAWNRELVDGAPALEIESAIYPGTAIPSMANAPMDFIHPKESDQIPWKTPLKIETIFSTTTRFDGQRIAVTDPDGNFYSGLLAVDGIRRVCGSKSKSKAGGTINVLTPDSIGKRFQIESATPRVNKLGEPINVEGETEATCKLLKNKFEQCWDVVISNPDDTFDFEF